MAACELNQIFLGEVASVQNYGAFVKIPGCVRQGLIYRTQVSSAQVADVSEVLQKGERVWCKVISIDEDGKVALSMKLVNQGNGEDLDPKGVQLQLDNQRKKSYNPRGEKKAIILEAVYKTTCTKCKTAGHLAKDCFSTPDGKKYELLPDEDEEESPAPLPCHQAEIEGKEKEEKVKKHRSKESKKKKHKSSKHTDSDSDDSERGSKASKKKKKKSKEAKRKKRKRKDSDSDSGSSSSVSDVENKKRSKKCKRSR